MAESGQSLDKLTGMLTRQAFEDHFATIAREAEAGEGAYSLAFLDLDHFQAVNATLGHRAGDEVLVRVAAIIGQIAEEKAIVGRHGGDEFALLFPGLEREQAFLFMERIRAAVAEQDIEVTCSVGLACYPVDAQVASEVLRKADQAIYRAKEAGRNQVRLAYDERMVPKTSHYTQTQLERLSKLAEKEGVGEAVLLREALDNLLMKYRVTDIES